MGAPPEVLETVWSGSYENTPPTDQHSRRPTDNNQPTLLLLAAIPARTDALAVGLIGVGIGAAAHTVSHVVGRDLGGKPEVDIPLFAVLTVLLLVAGLVRWRE